MAKQLQKEIDQLLECPICFEQIKEPKMLTCQHTFCLKPCLKNMTRRITYLGVHVSLKVKCAICRKEHQFDSFHDIPGNLQMQNLLMVRRKQAAEESRTLEMAQALALEGMYFLNIFPDYSQSLTYPEKNIVQAHAQS